MKKIQLHSIDQYAYQVGADGQAVAIFSGRNADRIDKLIEWLFTNTTGRFFLLGTETIYFENDDDATHFVLAWSE